MNNEYLVRIPCSTPELRRLEVDIEAQTGRAMLYGYQDQTSVKPLLSSTKQEQKNENRRGSCLSKSKRTRFFKWSIVASALAIIAIVLVGVLDGGLVLVLCPQLTTVSILDESTSSYYQHLIDAWLPFALPACALIALFFFDRYYKAHRRIELLRKRCLVDVCGAFIGGAAVYAFCKIIVLIIELMKSLDRLVIFGLVFAIPISIACFILAIWKKNDENLAFSCFGVAVSVASIYLSGAFFLLSVIFTLTTPN